MPSGEFADMVSNQPTTLYDPHTCSGMDGIVPSTHQGQHINKASGIAMHFECGQQLYSHSV